MIRCTRQPRHSAPQAEGAVTPASQATIPSAAEIAAIHSAGKIAAVRQAKRAPFFRGKLDHIDLSGLDNSAEWAKIPLLDKDMLRAMSDAEFYRDFCLPPREDDRIAQYWRSGGTTAPGTASTETSRRLGGTSQTAIPPPTRVIAATTR